MCWGAVLGWVQVMGRDKVEYMTEDKCFVTRRCALRGGYDASWNELESGVMSAVDKVSNSNFLQKHAAKTEYVLSAWQSTQMYHMFGPHFRVNQPHSDTDANESAW